MLPTPEASDGSGGRVSKELGGTRPSGAKRAITLATAVAHIPDEPKLLPTPIASDANSSGGSTPSDVTLTDAVVRTQMGTRPNPRHLFVTPLANLATNGCSQPEEKRRQGGHGPTLADQVEHLQLNLLPTPDATHERKTTRTSTLLPGLVEYFDRAQVDLGQDDPSRFGKYAAAVARWEQVIGVRAPDPTEPAQSGKRRLAPAFAAWMMGLHRFRICLPDNGLSRKAQLKMIGNAVCPPQAAHAVRGLLARAYSTRVSDEPVHHSTTHGQVAA